MAFFYQLWFCLGGQGSSSISQLYELGMWKVGDLGGNLALDGIAIHWLHAGISVEN